MAARAFRCPECRTRRVSFVLLIQHREHTGHEHCRCGGYPWLHRPGSPCCESNPMATVHRAMRDGGATDQDLDEAEMDAIWHSPGKPFTNWRV